MPDTRHQPLRILGVDPGSRITGYGVIEMQGGKHRHLVHGRIMTGKGEMCERLLVIHSELSQIIAEYKPHEGAVESVFVHKNVSSALMLGQARGAALVAIAAAGIAIEEYAPAQVKSSVVGYGRAEKSQVQHMIRTLLKLDETPPADAADALAVALCHAHHHASPMMALARGKRSGGWAVIR